MHRHLRAITLLGGGIKMHDSVKERLAKELAVAMRHVKEDTWEAFCKAADEASLDPYLALGVILVSMVESTLDETDASRN